MFEAAEIGHKVSPDQYDDAEPKLRTRLLQAHFALRDRGFAVIVIVAGADGAGKGELIHRFNEWLDPRGVETHAFWKPTDEERERPAYWRYWRCLPANGRIGIFIGGWYGDAIEHRVYGKMKQNKFDAAMDRVAAFESMLVDDGAALVKLWLHVPKAEQKKRLKRAANEGRLPPDGWKHFHAFGRFTKVSERALRRTEAPAAAWHIVEATDPNYRDLAAGQLLLEAMQMRLANKSPARRRATVRGRKIRAADSLLAHVDLSPCLAKDEYQQQLALLQAKLGKLAWAAQARGQSTVMVFEGWDAAGKGSVIRRVTQAMDPRLYRVIGTAAPSEEERRHHYLWRFWRDLPRAGFMTLFDRSWYGRVLVERVEAFANRDEWMRAYRELNEFEEEIAENRTTLVKFWLHISPDEQLRRFKARKDVAYKRYKMTAEDWRNRDKWAAYHRAVDDMVTKCSTEFAPWTIVAANDKRYARIQVLRTIVAALEAAV